MTQPVPYSPQTDFQEEETDAVAGRSAVRTAMIDVEFDAIATTLSQVLANLAIIQRDDTDLNDEIVTTASLSPEVKTLISTTGINPRGAWLTATSYAVKDVVETGTPFVSYICLVAHTSGVFATDRAAGKWMVLGQEPGTGTFTAVTITTGGVTLGTVGTQDLASTGNRFRDGWFGRTVTAATSVVTPLVSGGGVTISFGPSTGQWEIDVATGNFRPVATADNARDLGGSGNRVAHVFTPIIDSGTTASLSLKTNNGTTGFEIQHMAGTIISHLYAQASVTGTPAILGINSSDANVSMQFTQKGTGSFIFTDDSGIGQFEVLRTASASRRITITGSNGGNPTIGVTGGNLAITPNLALAGDLLIGTNPASVGPIRLPNNTFIRSRNAANSGDLSLIGLSSGDIILLGSPTSQILWSRAAIALGGGAAATLGTIGGSGPAAAAQRRWLPIIEDDGVLSFFPTWR